MQNMTRMCIRLCSTLRRSLFFIVIRDISIGILLVRNTNMTGYILALVVLLIIIAYAYDRKTVYYVVCVVGSWRARYVRCKSSYA